MLQQLRHIVYLNTIVSLSTGVLAGGFAHILGFKGFSIYFALFAFFATFAVYNGQRLFKINEAKTNWMFWVRDHQKAIAVATGTAAMAALAVFIWIVFRKLNAATFVLMAVAAIISAFYVMRIGGKNLRELPFVKIHLISLVWVLILILFPFLQLQYSDPNWTVVFAVCVAHYAYVVAITIPFDIRDLKYDKTFQKTIPQVAGIQTAKLIAVALLLFFLVVVTGVGMPIRSNPLFYIAVFTQIVLVVFMREDRSDLYCAGAIDGAVSLLGLAYLTA